MTEKITIRECWTRTEGWRQVEHGPWEPIDLSLYGGKPQIVWLNPKADYVVQEIIIKKPS